MKYRTALVGAASLAMHMAVAAAEVAAGTGHRAVFRSASNGRRRNPSTFDPKINHWTGRPHEHAREIARRLRQQARKEAAHG
ncbi:hypothetical protein F1640_18450 [Novosphingobium sp. NBM11]|uniref:hypothetical protein n=1 Tax=Novosphingobium sp. NBM11 TaxID=2596914 RepID=UPI0018923B68|nr:hypothetical protein [Novosphingobium sp. NBM11]MBF5091937.1 hypothetical protein [Novosphingobium sp. NBM11]